MSDIALTVSILALVAVVGLFIGNVKFRGIGLGIGGVLFGGIIVGHFVSQAGMTLSSDMLHVIQEFGLILFIDRNLNPQKTKKAPQNGCFFNTPCAPYERKRLLNRMTLIDTGY
ncbi:hypothetical protein POW98_21045, partial [Escherichia coli]